MNLTDYVAGNGRGREARDLELQAMNDPLLGDALDGLLEVGGDHSAAIDRLKKRIAGDSATRSSRLLQILCGSAAVLLLGVGGVLFLLQPGSSTPASEKLSPLAATIPDAEPEQTKAAALQSAAQAVAAQVSVAMPRQTAFGGRSVNSQRTQPAATAIDTVVITGYKAIPQTAFTGSGSERKPLGEILQKQLRVAPPPLPPDKNWLAESRPSSASLTPDRRPDPAVTPMTPGDREMPEFFDRFENDPPFCDPQPDDLPDDLYGGG